MSADIIELRQPRPHFLPVGRTLLVLAKHQALPRGGRITVWRNEVLGVERRDYRADEKAQWAVSWHADVMPDHAFASLAMLRAAMPGVRLS